MVSRIALRCRSKRLIDRSDNRMCFFSTRFSSPLHAWSRYDSPAVVVFPDSSIPLMGPRLCCSAGAVFHLAEARDKNQLGPKKVKTSRRCRPDRRLYLSEFRALACPHTQLPAEVDNTNGTYFCRKPLRISRFAACLGFMRRSYGLGRRFLR